MPRDQRRKENRFKRRLPFKIIPSGLLTEAAIDVGLIGLLMESSRFYEINQRIRLELLIPDEEPVYCDARVAWIEPHSRDVGHYKVGLEFIDLSLFDRGTLRKYLMPGGTHEPE